MVLLKEKAVEMTVTIKPAFGLNAKDAANFMKLVAHATEQTEEKQ